MRRRIIFLMVAMLVFTAFQGFAEEYDKEAVVRVMRGNVDYLGKMKTAMDAKDFFTVAQHLWGISEGMRSIRQYTPYRGEKKAWDRTIDEFLSTAYQGIGACGDQDLPRLQEVFGKLRAFSSQGHGMFR